MKINWIIEPEDITKVRKFLAQHMENPFVQFRIQNNVENKNPDLSLETFWLKLVACLLTTQQRSGPESPVSIFIRSDPFLLSYSSCEEQEDVTAFVTQTLTNFGGIRFVNKLGKFLSSDLSRLKRGLWLETKHVIEELALVDNPDMERKAALFIQKNLDGFGPKQSRNLLQSLGITRYEIPIDSRIIKWLNLFGFPLHLTSNSLQDIHYYNLISNGIQKLCEGSGIYPCVLDAVIFMSFDTDDWTEENVIW
jgi:hypothetical protein